MRFAFSEDQLMFRDAVRTMLSKECPPNEVRKAWERDTGRTQTVWNNLAEMGILGITGPERLGGLDLGPLDWVLLLEEMGRACLPEPYLEHSIISVSLLSQSQHDVDDWIKAACNGSRVILPALEPERRVVYGQEADAMILRQDDALYLVARSKLERHALDSVDGSRRVARVHWDGDGGALLASGPEVDAVVHQAFNLGALGTAATLLGLSHTMLDMTVEYAKVRTQFGKPIGSFQAIQHQLTDALLSLEFAKPQVYRAAWSMSTGAADQDIDVSMAKAYANAAADRVSKVALQVHGAIGYTTEYDLHFWMKRAWCLLRAFKDSRWHRRRVGNAVLHD